MFDTDDADLVYDLGILPPSTEPPSPPPAPAYATFDPVAVLDLPPRDRFAALLRVLRELEAEQKDVVERARQKYAEQVETLWRDTKRRGSKPFVIRAAEDELGEAVRPIFEECHRLVEARRSAYEKSKANLLELMRDAADAIVITRGDSRVLYATTVGSSYRSTGSPEKYAEARARLYAADLDASGVRSDVEPDSGDPLKESFKVWAHIDPADAEILKHKSGAKMVELVRRAWWYGVNPRVYWSFLPHGFEEKHGLDFFGGWVKPVSGQTSDAKPPEAA